MSLESRRDKIIYQGGIPLLAAILGAIAGVVIQHYWGAQEIGDAVKAVAIDPYMNAAEKLKILEQINKDSENFWGIIRSLTTAMIVPMAVLASAFADRIRNR